MCASRPEPPAPEAPDSLRERLRRLGLADPARSRADTRAAGDGHLARPHVGVPGRGSGVERIRAEYALDRRHGRCVLGDALEAIAAPPAGAGAAPGGRVRGLDLARTAYVDIETTGLAGGTGTYAFLIGVAYVDGQALVTEQFLLHHLGAERRLLASLQECLARARHLVTFNGRRFDWPILEARLVLARERPLPLEDHTDLIQPARWLWHRVLGTHRLSTLEAEVLGARRPNDVPGWLIPAIYVEYLRRGDRASLDPVLAHNRADLLAMVALHGEVARILRDPDAARGPLDWEGAGVLLAREGRHREALACLDRAAALAPDPDARWRILRRVARAYRLLGDADGARARWEREAAVWIGPDRLRVRLLEEVAKARARRGDADGARRAVEEALGLARRLCGPAANDPPPDLRRLTERLSGRLARLEGRCRLPILPPGERDRKAAPGPQ